MITWAYTSRIYILAVNISSSCYGSSSLLSPAQYRRGFAAVNNAKQKIYREWADAGASILHHFSMGDFSPRLLYYHAPGHLHQIWEISFLIAIESSYISASMPMVSGSRSALSCYTLKHAMDASMGHLIPTLREDTPILRLHIDSLLFWKTLYIEGFCIGATSIYRYDGGSPLGIDAARVKFPA